MGAFDAVSRNDFGDLLGVLEGVGLVQMSSSSLPSSATGTPSKSKRGFGRTGSFGSGLGRSGAGAVGEVKLVEGVWTNEVLRGLGISDQSSATSDDLRNEEIKGLWISESNRLAKDVKVQGAATPSKLVASFEDAFERWSCKHCSVFFSFVMYAFLFSAFHASLSCFCSSSFVVPITRHVYIFLMSFRLPPTFLVYSRFVVSSFLSFHGPLFSLHSTLHLAILQLIHRHFFFGTLDGGLPSMVFLFCSHFTPPNFHFVAFSPKNIYRSQNTTTKTIPFIPFQVVDSIFITIASFHPKQLKITIYMPSQLV
jgi:hypothetical protein